MPCPCVRHCALPMSDTLCVSVYSTPLIDAHPCATQFVPCPCVIYSLCPAPVSDTVLCPIVRCTLCQRQCVSHPCDRHSPLCHTVCVLPLCHTQFVPCPCVRHCALPWCQTHFVSEKCVFHPCDRYSPLCHTVCALPSCRRKFVLHPCVRQLCRN